jgi:hypothetical protein
MIRKCLPIPQKTYQITKRLHTPDEVNGYFPGFLAFIDSTEQQIPRHIDKDRRMIFYSGKKKQQTVKNQITINNHCHITHKTNHKKGKR